MAIGCVRRDPLGDYQSRPGTVRPSFSFCRSGPFGATRNSVAAGAALRVQQCASMIKSPWTVGPSENRFVASRHNGSAETSWFYCLRYEEQRSRCVSPKLCVQPN